MTTKPKPLCPLKVEHAVRHYPRSRTVGAWHIITQTQPDRDGGDLVVCLSMAGLSRQRDVVAVLETALQNGHAQGVGHWGSFLIYREGDRPGLDRPALSPFPPP
ncbi:MULTISPECIES: hypothetical protein [Cyanophyceae]|uniref:Uncharacterized protein n=1 Tax=Leptolyngbya subtilissima DQ-A4 TaxID=2933933 RepID=A0ABV0KBX7_9CYAN|nr:hypothetical protein [Nodosilinea sp. FACHB-141]MBD2111721.1 hypothetical protein [Nodosilinea sp. FACHB-141]